MLNLNETLKTMLKWNALLQKIKKEPKKYARIVKRPAGTIDLLFFTRNIASIRGKNQEPKRRKTTNAISSFDLLGVITFTLWT